MFNKVEPWVRLLVLASAGVSAPSLASDLSTPNTFSPGAVISSAQVNSNFSAVQDAVNSKQDAVNGACPQNQAISAIAAVGGAVTCVDINAAPPAAIDQSGHGSFWASPYQDRLADRVLMGAAVVNDGNNTVPNADWFSQLWSVSYNGGPGVASDGNFAQVYLLYDPNNPNASQPYPQPALTVASESLNSPSGATPRGLDFTAVNNSAPGSSPTVWGAYGEAHRVTASAGQTYVVELEARNSAAPVTGWNPDSTPGYGTIGLDVGCGAGLSPTGQYPCTAGMYFAANPEPWGAGIIFLEGSLGAYGSGGSYPAVMMPYNYSIQWWNGDEEASISSDTSGNLDLDTYGGGGVVLNGTLLQNSDQRLKTDVEPIADGDLDSLMQLAPVTYTWRVPRQQAVRETGFIAQEVREIFPDLVVTTEPTDLTPDGTLTVNYIGLIPHIIQSLKELVSKATADRVDLENRVAQLQNELRAKESRIDGLERRVDRMEAELKALSEKQIAQ